MQQVNPVKEAIQSKSQPQKVQRESKQKAQDNLIPVTISPTMYTDSTSHYIIISLDTNRIALFIALYSTYYVLLRGSNRRFDMLKSAVKYLCAVLIVLAGSGTGARGEWEFIDSGVTETLNDVYFTVELHGWAVGYNSTIITTTDGGETWIKQECPVSGLKLIKVVFKGETGICYCGLSTTWLMSHDSGKTWEIPDTDFTTMR
jgi:hypothetical protein